MAIRVVCQSCTRSFSAPDEYLGDKIKCPKCGAKVLVLSEEERRKQELAAQEKERYQREQEERIDLIEAMEKRRLTSTGSFAKEFGTGIDRVRNFNPGAVSRFRKLRALSSFMILGAYFLSGLMLAVGGTCIYLHREGVIESIGLLVLVLLGCVLLLASIYCLFKFLGELAWLLADLGDHQVDVRNLMLDLREDIDRMLAKR